MAASPVKLVCRYPGGINHSLQVDKSTSWSDVLVRMAQERPLEMAAGCTFTSQYLDDEGDTITITSQPGWEEALNFTEEHGTMPILNVLMVPAVCPPSACPPKCCDETTSSSCCPAPSASSGACNGEVGCCADLETLLAKSRDPAILNWVQGDFQKDAPPTVINPTIGDYKYSGESLRAFACPLGPNGGGCIALAGDGGLRQWQVLNRPSHVAHVPNSFFAIKTVDSSKQVKSAVLMSDAMYDQSGFTPAPMVKDHEVPAASVQLLKDLPGVKTLEMTGKYPVMEVDYTSGETPATLHLEAFNPCIPLNSKDSGLPVIIFNFTATNPTSSPIDVTLMGSQQNFCGWDGMSDITNEVLNAAYGGNVNSLMTMDGLTALDMTNPSLQADAAENGHVALAVLNQDGDKVNHLLQYESHNTLWSAFTEGDLPGQGQSGPSASGKTWNGALSCTRTLAANASSTFTFVLSWHFPNRYVNWSQAGFGIPASPTKYFIGNQYANFWPTITAVLEYTKTNMAQLTTATRTFRDAMFSGNLPWQLVDSAAGRMQVIRSPTSMWLGDGSFYSFEGCSTTQGCCPLNCTHVLNYAMALSRLWPDLEKSMRTNDLDIQMSPNGIIPSRSTVPTVLRRQWALWPNYTDRNPDQTICSDGEIGTVLKTYRETLVAYDEKWFADKFHQCQKIMDRWMTVMDAQGDGVIRGAQPTTYDSPLFGPNTFIGSLYMAALRASEEMAKISGDSDLAAKYHARFVLASTNYDKLCFTNGKWYTQVVTEEKEVLSTSTFVDALLGQWWAYLLNLGPLMTADHLSSTVSEVYNANHVTSFDPSRQAPRKFFDQRDAGMYIATWGGPSKPPPPHALLYTSEGAWTGLEYPFAGLALQCGLTDISLQVLKDARMKYDGTRRSPWNEIECGDHYSRQMAGFVLFDIAAGQTWDSPSQTLSYAPRLQATDFRSFSITGTGYGQYAQKGPAGLATGSAQIDCVGGAIAFKVLRLESAGKNFTVTVDGKAAACQVSRATDQGIDYAVLTFTDAVSIPAGASAIITIS